MPSNYFPDHELACPCCGKQFFDKETLAMFNMAREIAGIPFIPTSAYRCSKYNKNKTSSHLKGLAMDIAATGSRQRGLILKSLYEAGFTRIGINFDKGFIHADNDITKAKDVCWPY